MVSKHLCGAVNIIDDAGVVNSRQKLLVFRNLFNSVSIMRICGSEKSSSEMGDRADFKERRVQLPG